MRVDPHYPYTAVVHADLALCAMLDGRLDDALAHIGRAVAWDPRYARAVQRQAAIHGARGERDAAYRAVTRLAKLVDTFDRRYFDVTYPFRDPAHKRTFFDGLSKAGVNLAA
jgi:Tfp pilus assembly protein PilF